MQIIFNNSHLNDSNGIQKTSTLCEFVLGLPDIGLMIRKTKFIPPLIVINELLNIGKCDAGMSGYYEWVPFKIDSEEYEQLKKSLEKKLGSDVRYLKVENLSLKKWMSLARSNFKR